MSTHSALQSRLAAFAVGSSANHTNIEFGAKQIDSIIYATIITFIFGKRIPLTINA